MTAQTLTLTDFLLARIAEDEHAWLVDWPEINGGDMEHEGCARRVLAECEAKRRIVELHDRAGDAAAEYHERYDSGVEDGLEKAMHALALPYASHPDFRSEWRA